MRTHALYRFFNANKLLYVGITLDPGSRWKTHSKTKEWWHEVTRVKVERHPTREAALKAERVAIITEHPKYNVIHNHSQTTDVLVASSMPDDCHDNCEKQGIYSIYYPCRWGNGTAHYVCFKGHKWTCHWSYARAAGSADQCAGIRKKVDREELTPREIAQIEQRLAIPGYVGPFL